MNRLIPALLLGTLLGGCAAFQGAHPRGFAPWSDNDGRLYRAATPDGLVWRIRSEPHLPQAGLSFWKRAIRERLRGSGYQVVDSLAFQMGDRPAFAFEAGIDQEAWLVAIQPGEKRIVVVEVAGPLQAYQTHRQDILDALTRIQPR
ncbi:MAG: hypothetical protein H6686_10785 [Fibrobacteria bacterium]|nr:hypothetical protein [Fibrobacteria bacterium]